MKQVVQEMEPIITRILQEIDPEHIHEGHEYIQKSRRDIRYTIEFTIESLQMKQKSILFHYYFWLYQTLQAYQIQLTVILDMFDAIKSHLTPYLDEEGKTFLHSIQRQDIEYFVRKDEFIPKELSKQAQQYLDFLLKKDRHGANRWIQELIQSGVSLETIYLTIFQAAMIEIGRLWQYREISVADEHMATVITQFIMTQLYLLIFSTKKNGKKLVALALGSELHVIGIRMVSDYFEYRGFETHYLGANIPVGAVLSYIKQFKPDLLALSVTLGSHLGALKTLMEQIRADQDLSSIKVLIGGQAVYTIENAKDYFLADGLAYDALSAYQVGVSLVGQ